MKNLYIVSLEPYCGKTAISLALAINYQDRGHRVGYMKPLGTLPTTVKGITTDQDAENVCSVLGCDQDLPLVVPVLLTPDVVRLPLQGPVPDFSQKVRPALDQLSRGRDLMVLEGTANFAEGLSLGLSAVEVAEMTDSKVLLVTRSHRNLSLDYILLAQQTLRGRLLGVVVNYAPRGVSDLIRADLESFLTPRNLQLFGVIPLDRHLTAITVREIQDVLGAELLCCQEEQLDELVENFMIGAMNVDAALRYFQRKANKAVIVGGDRSDILLAALQTATKCLILTGNLRPMPVILSRAADANIPVLLAREDTMTVAEKLDRIMGRARMASPKQVESFVEVVKRDIDLEALKNALS